MKNGNFMKLTLKTKSSIETQNIAKLIAPLLIPGDVITLTGDLGAGKTTFVKGIAKCLKIEEDIISPTFNILKCYFQSKPHLYHIDAYRLENIHQELGLEEFIEGDGICVIEWPVFIDYLIPKDHLEVSIVNKGDNNREITFIGFGNHYDNIIEQIKKA
jgi:tRNA threonylcarbamoyladenosine biosynthesis protein TsaE